MAVKTYLLATTNRLLYRRITTFFDICHYRTIFLWEFFWKEAWKGLTRSGPAVAGFWSLSDPAILVGDGGKFRMLSQCSSLGRVYVLYHSIGHHRWVGSMDGLMLFIFISFRTILSGCQRRRRQWRESGHFSLFNLINITVDTFCGCEAMGCISWLA